MTIRWPQFIVDWVEKDSSSWQPLPSIRRAYIAGKSVRWEKAGAPINSDIFTSDGNKTLQNYSARDAGLPAGYGITHLQKQSPFGYLITRPFCFYAWWRIRPQRQEISAGNVVVNIPGSEIVPTFRFGKGRWDAGASTYIKPTLQAGLHYD